MEGLSLKLSGWFNPIFSLKFLTKYRPTESHELAAVMVKVAVEGVGLSNARTNVISSDMIADLINP